jgi:DNA-binding HxlR family transcriptional regulator/putative sterol carrier protein
MSSKRTYGDRCGIARALDLVGERWALLVVRELLLGPKRFTDLRAGLPHIGPDVLSQRLRDLERAGIVGRRMLAPPAASRVYELTDWGQELEPVVLGLGRWGSRSPVPGDDAVFGPDSAALALKTLFAPAPAAGLNATFELRLSDQWFSARVSDGRFEITRGEPDRADATIKTDPSTLAGVLWHGRSIRQAVRTGELEVQGDRVLADAFLRLFPLPETSMEGTAAARGHQR